MVQPAFKSYTTMKSLPGQDIISTIESIRISAEIAHFQLKFQRLRFKYYDHSQYQFGSDVISASFGFN